MSTENKEWKVEYRKIFSRGDSVVSATLTGDEEFVEGELHSFVVLAETKKDAEKLAYKLLVVGNYKKQEVKDLKIVRCEEITG